MLNRCVSEGGCGKTEGLIPKGAEPGEKRELAGVGGVQRVVQGVGIEKVRQVQAMEGLVCEEKDFVLDPKLDLTMKVTPGAARVWSE